MNEQLRSRLLEARNIAYVTFAAALLVILVVWFAMADRQSNLDRTTAEYNALNNIIQQGANTAAEIRRYFLLSFPQSIPEKEKIDTIISATHKIERIIPDINAKLQMEQLISLHTITKFNELIIPFHFSTYEYASPLEDVAPHSIIVVDRLEAHRLRDLPTLASYTSLDPVGVNNAVSRFEESGPNENVVDLANSLVAELHRVRSKVESENFSRMDDAGNRLKQAVGHFRANYGSLALGSHESSLEETLKRAREVQAYYHRLMREMEEGFDINIGLLEHKFPIQVVVTMFPVGLVIGYGMIAMLLAFVRNRLKEFDSIEKRQDAADIGIVFTQLRKPLWLEPITAWVALVFLFGTPVISSAYLAWQFYEAWTVTSSVFLLLSTTVAIVLSVVSCHVGFQISTCIASDQVNTLCDKDKFSVVKAGLAGIMAKLCVLNREDSHHKG